MSGDQLNSFFASPLGVGVSVVVCCAVLAVIAGVFYRKKQFSARVLSVSAMCIALSAILSNVKIWTMPQGGAITAFSMLFIVLVGYWFGPAAGVLAGVAGGLLNLAINPFVVHPIQLLLDYPFAFGALGISGFFRNFRRNHTIGKSQVKFNGSAIRYIIAVIGRWFDGLLNGLAIGYIVAVMARWFMSFISGYVFFSDYAGDMNPLLYSAVYNISYILPEMVITLIILSVPVIRYAIDMAGGVNSES